MRIGDRVRHHAYGEGTIRWLDKRRNLAWVTFDLYSPAAYVPQHRLMIIG